MRLSEGIPCRTLQYPVAHILNLPTVTLLANPLLLLHPMPPSHLNLKCCCSTSQLQHHPLFSLWLAQLDLISHFIIYFIIDNFGFSCISFLHSSLTFLQATLSNIPFMSASDNSLITPTLTSCDPLNLLTHLPILLIQLPFSYSTAWGATFLSSLPSYTLLVKTLYQKVYYYYYIIIIRVHHVQKYTGAILPHAALCHS